MQNNSICDCKQADFKNSREREYLFDGYITVGEANIITLGNNSYSIEYFQGEHQDEYLLKKDGKVCLFKYGILRMVYEENKYKAQIGDFTPFENGRTSFIQPFNDILDDHNFVPIINYV